MIDVNLRGVLHGITAALPVMQQQGHGYFINVSSTAGHTVYPTAAVYSATKCAVIAISEALRQEHDTMRVTIISPGATESELADSISDAGARDAMKEFRRVAMPPEAIRPRHIVTGQYLGFTALLAISLLGFLGGLVVPRAWIGLLGLAPILIGVKKFFERSEIEGEGQAAGDSASDVVGVAAVTFANGGDNIGIYTPLFASSGLARLLVMLGVFYLLLGVWCYFGYVMTRHPLVARVLARYSHIIVPFVLIGLGLYILIESGTLGLLGL